MAFVPKQLPEDEENQFGRTAPTTSLPPAQGGGSAGTGGGAAPGVGTSTQFGSNAAKLSDYLKANEQQVTNFGNQIAGDITNKYNQAKGDIDTGYNQFNQEVGSSYTPPDQNKVNQALQNPSEFAKDDKNVQDFQNWYNPQYKGPQNFEGSSVYSNLNNQVNQAVQNADLVNTQGGLGTYMNRFMGGKDTTEGMRTLDTALLQRNPQSRQAIQQAASPYKNLSSYLGDTTNKANQAIENKKGEVSKAGEGIRGQVKGVTDQFTKDLDDRITQSRTSGTSAADALKAAITGDGRLTDAEKKQFGAENWDEILKSRELLAKNKPFKDTQADYGKKFDLSPYMSMLNPETSYNRQNVASADDYAREAALQKLTGNEYNVLPDDLSVAGTAPKNLAQFDASRAGQDVTNRLSQLDTQFLDQYKDFNLGAGDEAYWRNLLKDPFQANSYQGMLDIYGRNADKLNPLQKGVSNQLSTWLQQAGTLPPQGGTGGDAKTPTDGTKSDGTKSDGTQPPTNLRVVNGAQQWFNGSEWVKPPAEYRNYVNGGYTEKFNYDTGKYEPTGWTGAKGPGAVGPGLVRTGGGSTYQGVY